MTAATGLCVIPTCRIRGRHLPACADDNCGGCLPRQATEGNTCDVCDNRTRDRLAAITELADDARAVARGEVRRGDGGNGGKPGSRPPLNDGATDALDAIRNTLGTWVRHISEERGTHPERVPHGFDVLAASARFLAANLPWMRHRPEVDEFVADVADCAGRIRGLVNGPMAQRYLGPCGAVRKCEGLEPDDWPEGDCGDHTPHGAHEFGICPGDVYAQRGGRRGRCRVCRAEVASEDREAWLDAQARSSGLAWTASGIADAYGLSVKTIRSWATERRAPNGVLLRRAKLATYWHNGTQLVPWVDPLPGQDVKARGDRLHYVADVVALAEEAADRRAQQTTTTESETAA